MSTRAAKRGSASGGTPTRPAPAASQSTAAARARRASVSNSRSAPSGVIAATAPASPDPSSR